MSHGIKQSFEKHFKILKIKGIGVESMIRINKIFHEEIRRGI
jgi:hypothetical protein